MTASVIKNSSLILLLILPAIVVCFGIGVDFTSAAATDNVSGWAWSSTIGWISFNGANYGVHICESDIDPNPYCAGVSAPKEGKLVGYAWSENIGWVMFNPPSPYPAVGPNYSAKLDTTTYQITGWARACAGSPNGNCTGGVGAGANAGGWDGWIKLADSTYGVNIDFVPSPPQFHNHAWGSDVVGWISFNCVEGGVAGGNICGTSNYKVTTTYSPKPKVINLDIRQTADYCTAGPSVTVSWTFVGDSQSAYQVRIYEGNFATLVKDSGKVSLSSNSFSTIDGITYNKTYSWEVQVWNSKNQSSGWVRDTKTIITPAHRYPDNKFLGANAFNISPIEPAAGEPFNITNNSNCYGINNLPANCSSWIWTFSPDGNPLSSNIWEPAGTVFLSQGTGKIITLTMADADGHTCTVSKNIDVTLPLPEWREITPR